MELSKGLVGINLNCVCRTPGITVELRGLFDFGLAFEDFFVVFACLFDFLAWAEDLRLSGSDLDFEIPELRKLANKFSSSSALLLLSSPLLSCPDGWYLPGVVAL